MDPMSLVIGLVIGLFVGWTLGLIAGALGAAAQRGDDMDRWADDELLPRLDAAMSGALERRRARP